MGGVGGAAERVLFVTTARLRPMGAIDWGGEQLGWMFGGDSAGFVLAASDLDRLRYSVGPLPSLAGHRWLSRFTVFTIGGPIGNPVVLLASSAMMVGVFSGLPTVAFVRLAVTFNVIWQSDGIARNGCLFNRRIALSPYVNSTET